MMKRSVLAPSRASGLPNTIRGLSFDLSSIDIVLLEQFGENVKCMGLLQRGRLGWQIPDRVDPSGVGRQDDAAGVPERRPARSREVTRDNKTVLAANQPSDCVFNRGVSP
jgi:hypothetical protein